MAAWVRRLARRSTQPSARPAARRGDESGAVAVFTAVAAVLVMGIAVLAVDVGNVMARGGMAQSQADHAAVFAASYLPVRDDDSELTVAKAVAYYVACNPVPGQSELDEAIPECPTSASSSTLDGYAGQLLANGKVSFPRFNQVRVKSPTARVDYGFAGVFTDDPDTEVTRDAIAQVSSPGEVAPIGLSLNCLLSVGGSLPAGIGDVVSGVLPINYLAPGVAAAGDVATDWPQMPTSNKLQIRSMTPSSTYQGTPLALPTTVLFSGAGLLGLEVKFAFALGTGSGREYVEQRVVGAGILDAGVAEVPIPSQVTSRAGNWQVRVGVKRLGSWEWSRKTATFSVTVPPGMADMLGCGRILKSPRNQQDGTKGNVLLNLQEGIDHPLSTHPALLTTSLPNPLTPGSLLASLGGLTKCSNNRHPDVMDNGGNLRGGKTPNCVDVLQGNPETSEFTEGMLGPERLVPGVDGGPGHLLAGRLVCTDNNPCERSTTISVDGSTRSVNADRFSDYILPERRSLLTASTFFNLSSYVLPGLPVITPDSALHPAIYSSHRFMWVPVMAMPMGPSAGGQYPVLTFRPIFVTQDLPTELASGATAMLRGWLDTLLGLRTMSDDHGIVTDDSGNLRALRFMTVEPTALPAILSDYSGPVSDYLGVGPKVIRLVK